MYQVSRYLSLLHFHCISSLGTSSVMYCSPSVMLFAINTLASFSFCVTEPIIVEVVFRNPLKVPLALSALSLVWKFTLKDFSDPQGGTTGETITNEKEAASLKEVRLLIISQFIVPEASSFEFLISLINFCAFESVPDHGPQ